MFETLTRNWWIQLIRGALALALGVTALIAPSTSMVLATFLVAAFAIGDGAMTVTAGIGIDDDDTGRARGVLIGTGAAFIALGLVVLFWSGIPVAALVALFAVWLIGSGALLAYGARELRPQIPAAGSMIAVGIAVAVIGLALLVVGPSTVDAVLPFAGWFGVVVGLILGTVSLRLRRDSRALPEQALVA